MDHTYVYFDCLLLLETQLNKSYETEIGCRDCNHAHHPRHHHWKWAYYFAVKSGLNAPYCLQPRSVYSTTKHLLQTSFSFILKVCLNKPSFSTKNCRVGHSVKFIDWLPTQFNCFWLGWLSSNWNFRCWHIPLKVKLRNLIWINHSI